MFSTGSFFLILGDYRVISPISDASSSFLLRVVCFLRGDLGDLPGDFGDYYSILFVIYFLSGDEGSLVGLLGSSSLSYSDSEGGSGMMLTIFLIWSMSNT